MNQGAKEANEEIKQDVVLCKLDRIIQLLEILTKGGIVDTVDTDTDFLKEVSNGH